MRGAVAAAAAAGLAPPGDPLRARADAGFARPIGAVLFLWEWGVSQLASARLSCCTEGVHGEEERKCRADQLTSARGVKRLYIYCGFSYCYRPD